MNFGEFFKINRRSNIIVTTISFISKTKELIPNEDKIRKKFPDEFFVQKILNNYISIKNPNNFIDIEDPISFILINCD